MKRYGDLWDRFISKENIEKSKNQAIKGKRTHKKVQQCLQEVDIMTDIPKMLEEGTLPPHDYRTVVIYEGKQRNIYVIDFYSWRIIHHMVINVIEDIFEKGFIAHTYGCIKGRGQHKGSLHCQKFANKFKYILKCDISKFYPSVNQEILFEIIKRKIKDEKLLKIIKEIIFSHYQGLPIGNLPSQLFGNVYFSVFDHYVKHTLRFKNYIRYVDDFIFASNDKEELREISKIIEQWLYDNLKLKLSKNDLFKAKQGIDFLGYRHFNGYRLLRKKTATRIKRKLKKIEKKYNLNQLTLEQCVSVIQSFYGWVKHCNSYNLRNTLKMENLRQRLTYEEFLKNDNVFISGQKLKIDKVPEGDGILNAFNFTTRKVKGKEKHVIQLQIIYDDKTYYITSCSNVLRKQFKEVKKENVPCILQLKTNRRYLYAT